MSRADAGSPGVNAVHERIARIAAALQTAPTPSPVAERRAGAVLGVLGQTVLINMLALVIPLVTLAVFDYVARDGARISLALLCATGGLAVVDEMVLRRSRRALLSEQGAHIVSILAGRYFKGMLGGGPRASADPGEHVGAMRDLRRLRALLTSSASSALLDAPFILVFIGVLAVFAGPIALAPALAVIAYGLIAVTVRPRVRRALERGARAREDLRAALAESAAKAVSIDELGMRRAWAARVESLAVGVAMRREKESVAEATLEAAAHLVTALAVLATLWIGAQEVMAGVLTVGGAIAAVMLTWRCVAPLEHLLQSTGELRAAFRVARSALRLRREAPRSNLPTFPVSGRIEVRGLEVRIDGAEAPALRGISFDVAPGEIIAVCGSSGAGKSTLLASLLNLRTPDAGVILMDGRDIRGADPEQHRMRIGYAPQRPTLFHGTVAQNIRLLAPGATDETIADALAAAGVVLPHPQLPHGLETRLRSGGTGQIDESLRMKLMLAGVHAKQARLLLLDDPGANLDRDGDRRFLETLASLRGKATVILVTNRPSHMRACDRIIRLEHGLLVTDGRVEQVLAG